MVADGQPVTLAGRLLLTFAADGRFRNLRKCWNLAEGSTTRRRTGAADPEADQDPRFGTPFASPTGAAVEWWATTIEEGHPPSSAPRSSPSPPTAWSPLPATTGS
jgi:hypothetical protein